MSEKISQGGLKTTKASVQLTAGQQSVNELQIEDTIFEESLPVNSMAVLNRITQLLQEHGTNSFKSCRDDLRLRRAMWLLNAMFYGQMATVDLTNEWYYLHEVRE